MKAEYMNHMGDDDMVVDAARVSFSKTADKYTAEENEKLIKYLATNGHWTPFAHPQITLRMTAPIAIRTQCFKHKQGFVENEESRRYISTTPVVYRPMVWRSKPDGSIKQGSGYEHSESDHISEQYHYATQHAVKAYESMVRRGVAPEQARFVLPQGVETQWVWTGSLAAYARFYRQRTDSHAQKEIQDLAHMVGEIIKPLFPVSWVALIGDD